MPKAYASLTKRDQFSFVKNLGFRVKKTSFILNFIPGHRTNSFVNWHGSLSPRDLARYEKLFPRISISEFGASEIGISELDTGREKDLAVDSAEGAINCMVKITDLSPSNQLKPDRIKEMANAHLPLLGIIVSKKNLPRAVDRNKAKRRLRSIFQSHVRGIAEHRYLDAGAFIFILHKNFIKEDFAELERQIDSVLKLTARYIARVAT